MPRFLRAVRADSGAAAEAGTPIKFIASTEGVKRDGKNLAAADWKLENFRKNPVVLWSHDYGGRNLPIGRAVAEIDGQQLVSEVTFDQADEFARKVEQKYRDGYLNTVSVGWDDVAACPNCGERVSVYAASLATILRQACPSCKRELPKDIKVQHELLDISAVNVPGDPDALMERQYQRLRALYEEEPADAAAAAVGLQWEEAACLMVRALDPGALLTDDQRRKAYNRAERFYRQLGKRAPELLGSSHLAALGPEELRGLYLEGEPELWPALFTDARVGAVLNARNRGDLEQAVTLVQGVLDRSTKEPDKKEAAAGDEERAAVDRLTRLKASLQAFPAK